MKLLYGEGLHIRRLEPGTEMRFTFLTNAPQSPHRLRYCFSRSDIVKVIIVEDEFLAQQD